VELAVNLRATATEPGFFPLSFPLTFGGAGGSGIGNVVGDLMIDDEGHEVLLTFLGDEVAQRLYVRFQFFKGEWFLDEEEGFPWFERILRKRPDDRVIRAIFREVIEGTEGVTKLTYFVYSINSATRRMEVDFRCQLEDGSTFRATDFVRYAIDV